MSQSILIVDDEQPIRDLLTRYFAANGFTVSAASSATEALAEVKRLAPDLIITDLQLQDSDGLTMILRIKQQLPGVPVILLTGALFDAASVEQSLQDKVSCYLPKTTSLAKIAETVRRLIGSRS